MVPPPSTLLGQSAANNTCALRFLRVCRAVDHLPEEIHQDEISGENLCVFMRNLLHFMSSHVIPAYFDDNFEPSKDPSDPTPVRVLTGATLDRQSPGRRTR